MIIYFMLNLKQGTESSVFFNVIIMYMKNAQNVPSVHEPAEVAKRRTTDVVKKDGTALSVEREDEERKAFERLVDQACEILNNFKVPETKRHSWMWLVAVVLIVVVGNWFVFSPAEDEPKITEQSAKAVVKSSVSAERPITEDVFAEARQADRATGYSSFLVNYKYRILHKAQKRVEALQLAYERATQVRAAAAEKYVWAQDSLQNYQNRLSEISAQIETLTAKPDAVRAYRQQMVGLCKEKAILAGKVSYYVGLQTLQGSTSEKVDEIWGKWQAAENELTRLWQKTQDEWCSEAQENFRVGALWCTCFLCIFTIIFGIFRYGPPAAPVVLLFDMIFFVVSYVVLPDVIY